MKIELAIKEIPDSLCFIMPQLPSTGHQDYVIGKIATLIEHLFPQSSCKPANIYRLLIDELHRKGQVVYDYKKWDQLLKNKALTSKTVHEVVIKNTDIAGIDQIKTEVDKIASALGMLERASVQLGQRVIRYYNSHVISPSALRLHIVEYVKRIASGNPSLEYMELIELLEQNVPNKIKKTLIDSATLKAAIIYELIQVDNGE